jgi:hypothetical protein
MRKESAHDQADKRAKHKDCGATRERCYEDSDA